MATISANLQQVHTRIVQACAAAGRNSAEITLLAVSKTMPAAAVREAVACGQRAFGENYVQEAVDKIGQLTQATHLPPLSWHCIGPLQSNKTRLVAEHFHWVHTVDRLKIAERLSAQRPAHLPALAVCIQVNIDGGTSKAGAPPEQTLVLARQIADLPRLQLRGLMTIPEPAPDFASQLAVHRRTRDLFEALRIELGLPQFDTLSMGMTADLEAAIHAGSTLLRVGTAIFGARSHGTA